MEKEVATTIEKDTLKKLNDKKTELEDIRQIKVDGAMMRSKATWVE